MNAKNIVIWFFAISGIVLILGLASMGITFWIMTKKRLKNPEIDDKEYITYLKRGYVLRFCYGYNVAADTFLRTIEIVATGIGTFIVLIDDIQTKLVAIMLITSFISSSIRGALNLKYNRIAYARAFRKLEFATDIYRISKKNDDAKKELLKANEAAQEIISDFVD